MLGGAGFETRAVGAGASKAELSDANALVVVSAAAGGAGGVEPTALPALMAAVPDSVTRLLYVSVHGVERTGQMPFSMQNVFGQLDKLRAAEQEVQLRALNKVPSYSIVRVGKISGGGERCEVLPGDGLQGDVSAAAAGAVVRESLLRAEASTPAVGRAGRRRRRGDRRRALGRHVPQARRARDLPQAAESARCGGGGELVQEWAQGFFKEGQKLTTPIQVENVEDGVCIRFLEKGGTGYADFDERDHRRPVRRLEAAAAPAARRRARRRGALLVVAEAAPSLRVRVARAEMREGTVVEEMSEQTKARATREGSCGAGEREGLMRPNLFTLAVHSRPTGYVTTRSDANASDGKLQLGVDDARPPPRRSQFARSRSSMAGIDTAQNAVKQLGDPSDLELAVTWCLRRRPERTATTRPSATVRTSRRRSSTVNDRHRQTVRRLRRRRRTGSA